MKTRTRNDKARTKTAQKNYKDSISTAGFSFLIIKAIPKKTPLTIPTNKQKKRIPKRLPDFASKNI